MCICIDIYSDNFCKTILGLNQESLEKNGTDEYFYIYQIDFHGDTKKEKYTCLAGRLINI